MFYFTIITYIDASLLDTHVDCKSKHLNKWILSLDMSIKKTLLTFLKNDCYILKKLR